MNTNINTNININILIQRKHKYKINININITINIKNLPPTCFGSSVPSIESTMCHVQNQLFSEIN